MSLKIFFFISLKAFTIKGAPFLKQEHYPVFDCANLCGDRGNRYIPVGHIRKGEYDDGSLGELFIDMDKKGASFCFILNCFTIAVP
ncbi:hypothetical protein [Fulvivirga sediminis]|uniref:Uncharacterized protein n=1 Tax=Fulvivirga sediminis TaxID=2803949 RepID=A0A937FB60_9BACT|nr:hypothetical protein [Fulvivirga sediminis]MBL3657645.1 hypothetical protein [Fulvivirga sediminis]